MVKTRYPILFIAVIVICFIFSAVQAAEKYPTRQIDLVCGYPPGTGPDILNRILARYLEKELGVTVVPINKVGGGVSWQLPPRPQPVLMVTRLLTQAITSSRSSPDKPATP